ncbi:MAG: hypothetical protein FRX48_00450 [Lasallia pustulata]|uniref:Uncharacterized protein n=1 Tax=Lasallia pustulata TaxID=136370 RepID=A0A5M8Q1X1_9LECA|nr:MAG: hypothetical protein FRX48_00450 [Lasallia pustulata]
MAGVKTREVPTPPRMEKVKMKCQYPMQNPSLSAVAYAMRLLRATTLNPGSGKRSTHATSPALTRRHGKQHHPRHQQHAPRRDQPPGPMRIENRPDLDPAEKRLDTRARNTPGVSQPFHLGPHHPPIILTKNTFTPKIHPTAPSEYPAN